MGERSVWARECRYSCSYVVHSYSYTSMCMDMCAFRAPVELHDLAAFDRREHLLQRLVCVALRGENTPRCVCQSAVLLGSHSSHFTPVVRVRLRVKAGSFSYFAAGRGMHRVDYIARQLYLCITTNGAMGFPAISLGGSILLLRGNINAIAFI